MLNSVGTQTKMQRVRVCDGAMLMGHRFGASGLLRSVLINSAWRGLNVCFASKGSKLLAKRNRIVLPSYLRASLLERVRGAVNRAFVEMFCDQHHADW
jgi:hypothetical protein